MYSDEFSLDTIGSGGSLKSKGVRGRVYEVGVGISLSYFALTKIVTFTPLRMLSNHTKVWLISHLFEIFGQSVENLSCPQGCFEKQF